MTLAFLAVTLAAQAAAPTGEHWVEIYRSEARTVYLDPGSIRSVRGNMRSARTRTDYSPPEPMARSYYTQDVDCDARAMALTDYASYDRDGGVIRQGSIPTTAQQFSRVEPDTQGEAVLNSICR
jgi:hypothetical protein